MFKRIAVATFMLCGLLMIPPTGHTEGAQFGFRAGFGIEPDQFVVGGHAVFGRYLKVFRFAPSVDLGFGDDRTTYNANGDFRFSLVPPNSNVRVYLGGGPTLSHEELDAGGGDTEVGISAIGGIGFPMGNVGTYGLELRAGFGDIPDFRALFTLSFGGGTTDDDEEEPDVIIETR